MLICDNCQRDIEDTEFDCERDYHDTPDDIGLHQFESPVRILLDSGGYTDQMRLCGPCLVKAERQVDRTYDIWEPEY